jgi:hypothetical protein
MVSLAISVLPHDLVVLCRSRPKSIERRLSVSQPHLPALVEMLEIELIIASTRTVKIEEIWQGAIFRPFNLYCSRKITLG